MPLTNEDRKTIFNKLKSALEKQSPPLVISKNEQDGFELIGNKPVPYGSKKILAPGMYFCSLKMAKDSVSFHFFPMYYHETEYLDIIPTMIKCLKGKTCFHFKKPELVNEKELNAMLKKGVEAWNKSGYMK